ncbi:ABC transporter permease subunit [Mammaliicoccus sciuri]|uniref:ABC transporter permease subunit n=1 Tax=Mammaliicoccus sciuri TaxID=1296 RepID=UPI001A9802DA|nr:ABC transporter permease subunit [Mammaliicoccus sciuri]MBO1220131.1 ABC transporter permease subunit [Mammaliicoccus sciuri]MBO1233266.1 ABC transporter permease subunit [Mammaliicoccus sciuri]
MNIAQHVKYDLTRIFKSPLGYLGFLISLFPGIAIMISVKTLDGPFDAQVVLAMFFVFGGLVLLMFSIRTIVRDMQYGTIQLFLNSKTNRVKYLYGKLLSIIGIVIIFTILGTLFTLLASTIIDAGELSVSDYFKMLGEFLLIMLFYGILLNILNLLTGKSAVVYTTAIILILFLPNIFDAFIFIPEIGEDLSKMMKYNPLDFLPKILNQGSLTMKVSQIWISVACIAVFTGINHYMIRNKNI